MPLDSQAQNHGGSSYLILNALTLEADMLIPALLLLPSRYDGMAQGLGANDLKTAGHQQGLLCTRTWGAVLLPGGIPSVTSRRQNAGILSHRENQANFRKPCEADEA